MTKTSCKIVCPFCSLLCDDVTVSLDNNRFEVKNKNLSLCKKKIEFFNLDKNNRLTPTINNKTSSLRETMKSVREARRERIHGISLGIEANPTISAREARG